MAAHDENNGNILKTKEALTATESYFSELSKVTDLLTREEEVALMRKIRSGDKKAYKAMIEKNLRLVVHVALNIKHGNDEFGLMDRISEGNLGLMHAIEKFDADKGFRFSTYAYWWIKQSIEKAVMNQGRQVRLPKHVVQLLSKFNKASCRITGNKASLKEIASELDCAQEYLERVLADAGPSLSMDAAAPGSDMEYSEVVADAKSGSGLQDLERHDLQVSIIKVLAQMAPYEHFILVRRMGLAYNERNTLEQLSVLTALSREQIRAAERRAIKKHQELFKSAL